MANAGISLHGIVDEIGKVKGALREEASRVPAEESDAIADIIATLDSVEEQVRGLCGDGDHSFCCPPHSAAAPD